MVKPERQPRALPALKYWRCSGSTVGLKRPLKLKQRTAHCQRRDEEEKFWGRPSGERRVVGGEAK